MPQLARHFEIKPARRKRRSRDLVDDALAAVSIHSRSDGNAANLLDCPPRAVVVWSDEKDHAVYEAEGMLQHESLQGAILLPGRVRSRQDRRNDFDFVRRGIVRVVSR